MKNVITMAIVQPCQQLLHIAPVHDEMIQRDRGIVQENVCAWTRQRLIACECNVVDYLLYLGDRELHSRPVGKPREIMIHVFENHIYAPFVLIRRVCL